MVGLENSKDVYICFLFGKSFLERVRSTLGVEIETVMNWMGFRDVLLLSYFFLVVYELGEVLMLMSYNLTID